MSILHKWPCQDCGQVINGPHSNLPDAASRRRADELRAEGWEIWAMDPGCTWHGYWSMRQSGERPAWHGGRTLDDLLALAESTPPDRWEEFEEWDRAYAKRLQAKRLENIRRNGEAVAAADAMIRARIELATATKAPVYQLSLFEQEMP